MVDHLSIEAVPLDESASPHDSSILRGFHQTLHEDHQRHLNITQLIELKIPNSTAPVNETIYLKESISLSDLNDPGSEDASPGDGGDSSAKLNNAGGTDWATYVAAVASLAVIVCLFFCLLLGYKAIRKLRRSRQPERHRRHPAWNLTRVHPTSTVSGPPAVDAAVRRISSESECPPPPYWSLFGKNDAQSSTDDMEMTTIAQPAQASEITQHDPMESLSPPDPSPEVIVDGSEHRHLPESTSKAKPSNRRQLKMLQLGRREVEQETSFTRSLSI